MREYRRPVLDYARRYPLPLMGTEDEEWRIRSLCRNHPNPDLWIPGSPGAAHAGRQICRQCPVQKRCAEYALARREPHGTWGGITEWERSLLLRNR